MKVLLVLILSSTAAFAADPKPIVLEKPADLVKAFEGTSEAQYYEQFLRPSDRKSPTKAEIDTDFDATKKVFEDLKPVMLKSKIFETLKTKNALVAAEWESRLKAATLEKGGISAMTHLYTGSGASLKTMDLLGRDIQVWGGVTDGANPDPQIVVTWGMTETTPLDNAGKAFFLGHELTHIINWAPDEVVACLTDAKGYGARQPKKLADLTDKEKVFAAMFDPRDRRAQVAIEKVRMDVKDSLAIGDDAKKANEMMSRCKVNRRLIVPLTPAQREALDMFKKKNMDGPVGWGTDAFVFFQDCFAKDAEAATELWTILKKYNAQSTPLHTFVTQVVEAAADFYGVEYAVEYLLTAVTPANQKAAALKLLKSLPPSFLPASAREPLDYVGSKPTNEKRIIGLLLAHPGFQKMLGTKPKTATRYCGK